MTKGDPDLARAAILEAVENQLRDNEPPEANETFDRLTQSGHSKDEAKRLIAAVLANEIFEIAKTGSAYDQDRYLSRLKCGVAEPERIGGAHAEQDARQNARQPPRGRLPEMPSEYE